MFFSLREQDCEILLKPSPSTNEIAFLPPSMKGVSVTIISSTRSFLKNDQLVVPPPSTKSDIFLF